MKRRWLPEWVSEYRDRHGKKRYRFRRKGFAQYAFRNAPGTEGFREEYRACIEGTEIAIVPGADRVRPGTFDALLVAYYRSPDFLDVSDRTRVVYRGTLERWRAKYGKGMVRDLEARHVETMMADMMPHRTAANMLRKRLRALMSFAVRQGLIKNNPVLATKPYKVKSDGYHTWTEDEIDRYTLRHPLGSMARLAFDLLLWTGQRGGDVRVIGVDNLSGPRLTITQEKTGVTVSLPILKPLADSLVVTASGVKTFIVTEHGRTFSRKGFGNKFRQWCDEAGLPHCSAHGLRKASARRFAEAGCSNQQIKAWTGHVTDAEVSRYTAAADQQALSDSAADKLMANLRERLAKKGSKQLKSEA